MAQQLPMRHFIYNKMQIIADDLKTKPWYSSSSIVGFSWLQPDLRVQLSLEGSQGLSNHRTRTCEVQRKAR